jgi:PAS domain S-box-containing protein
MFLENLDNSQQLDLFKLAFENAFNPIVITDADLSESGPKFLYVNVAFENMTGYKLEEIKDKTPRILQGPKSDRAMLDNLKETIAKGEFFQGRNINYKKSGEAYNIEWNISSLYEGDKIAYYVSIQKDVTQEVKNEQLQTHLLAQQSKMATMGEMIQTILHQWQQPLSALSLHHQYLMLQHGQDKLTDTLFEHEMKQIQQQIDFMADTSRVFSDFFRPDKELRVFSLSRFVHDTLELLHPLLKRHFIDLTMDCDEEIEVQAHINELSHVLINLVNNAIYALLDNSVEHPHIHIESKLQDNSVVLMVSDNGGGIDESIIEKIFEPNFTTKGDKGSGVGLYIAKKIVEENNQGTLSVYNTAVGALFSISLPIYKEELS